MNAQEVNIREHLLDQWTPNFWQNAPATQQIHYEDPEALQHVLDELSALPPLVAPHEVAVLKSNLSAAQEGKCFILQAGDCAERFSDCNRQTITSRLHTLMQMQCILAHGLKRPVVCIGRLAGQYAKPRTDPFETRDGVTLPSFRGDIVNDPDFSPAARRHDPSRLLKAYARSAFTINLMRNLMDAGLPDLAKRQSWNLDWLETADKAREYRRIASAVIDSVRFTSAMAESASTATFRMRCYTSHEALHLHYEQAQTHLLQGNRWINLSTHFPWLGLRTAMPGGAHMEYLRGIENPIAVKIGPSTSISQLIETIDILNPTNLPGKLSLITRMGVDNISHALPPLIKAVQEEKRRVLWMVDPMHGNTETTAAGYKTRNFDRICSEIKLAVEIHRNAGTQLGGVHLEMSGEDVTECIGGAANISEQDLPLNYLTSVDPRLNAVQAIEIALFTVSKMCSQW